jgi:histone H3/H4
MTKATAAAAPPVPTPTKGRVNKGQVALKKRKKRVYEDYMLGVPRKNSTTVPRLIRAAPFNRAFRRSLEASVKKEFGVFQAFRFSEEALTQVRQLIEKRLVHFLHSAAHLTEDNEKIVVKPEALATVIAQRKLALSDAGPRLKWIEEYEKQAELRKIKRQQKKQKTAATAADDDDEEEESDE